MTALPMMAGNENADPAEASASGAGLKAPVPSRDRRLVLSAIDGQVNAAKASWREKHGAAAGAGKQDFILDCIDQAGASMKRQVAAATVPADAAEGALDAFETELLAVRPLASPRTDAESDDDESLSSVDDEGDLSFDDAEVLDREAHDRARELRARAREVAARVIAVREEASGRALEITRRQVAELLEAHGYSEDDAEGRDDGGPAEGAAAAEGTGASAAMQQALQALASRCRASTRAWRTSSSR